jgi:hypothetical protein
MEMDEILILILIAYMHVIHMRMRHGRDTAQVIVDHLMPVKSRQGPSKIFKINHPAPAASSSYLLVP